MGRLIKRGSGRSVSEAQYYIDPQSTDTANCRPCTSLRATGRIDTGFICGSCGARDHIAHVVENTFPGSAFNYSEGCQQSEAPLINSEYGGISAGHGDQDISWSFKYLTNELRKYAPIGGYIYTELMDIEWAYEILSDPEQRAHFDNAKNYVPPTPLLKDWQRILLIFLVTIIVGIVIQFLE